MRLRDGTDDAARQMRRLFIVRHTPLHYCEFIPTEPRHDVSFTQHCAQALGHTLE